MIKRIPLLGVVTEPGERMDSDSMTAESINIRTSFGECAPVCMPKDISSDYGLTNDQGRVIYIHKDNAIILNQGLYVWRSKSAAGDLFYSDEELKSVTSMGNTLIISTSDSMHYLLWKDGVYLNLGGSIPSADVAFYAHDISDGDLLDQATYNKTSNKKKYGIRSTTCGTEKDSIRYTIPYQSPNSWNTDAGGSLTTHIESDTEKMSGTDSVISPAGFVARIWDAIDIAVAANASKGICNFPYFLVAAVRLYDGTYTRVTPPVYVDTFNGRMNDYGCIKVSLDAEVKNKKARVGATVDFLNNYRVGVAVKDADKSFEGWDDIVAGVDIFISTAVNPHVYKDKALVHVTKIDRGNRRESSIGLGSVSTETEEVGDWTASLILDPKSFQNKAEKLLESHDLFYLVTSFSLDEYRALAATASNGITCFDLDENVQDDWIVTQKRLEYTYQSAHEIQSMTMSTYNQRILAHGLKQRLSGGYGWLNGFRRNRIVTESTESSESESGETTTSTTTTTTYSDGGGLSSAEHTGRNRAGTSSRRVEGSTTSSSSVTIRTVDSSRLSSSLFPVTSVVDDPTTYTYGYVFHVMTDQGEKKVFARSNDSADPLAYEGHIGPFKGKPYTFLSYPDSRCETVDVIYTDTMGNRTVKTYRMKVFGTTDSSYCFVGWDTMFAAKDERGILLEDYSVEENSTETITNRLWQSKVANPFVFPAESRHAVGSGDIIGVASATIALSENQYGNYPLYVFTTEGIWALPVAQDGSLPSVPPSISRDVCDNPSSITCIDRAVVFTTSRGLFYVSDYRVTDLTPKYKDINYCSDPSVVEALADTVWSDVYGASVTDQSFISFLKGAHIAYDYQGSRLLLIRDDKPYQYSYIIDSQSWHKTYYGIAIGAPVNSYPQCLVNVHKKGSVRLYDLSTILDMSDTSLVPLKGVIVTRALDFEANDIFKSLTRLELRGRFDKKKAKFLVQGSNDGVAWRMLHSLRGASWRWFRIIVVTDFEPNDRFDYIEVDVQPRYTARIR